jgi:phosphodiesterase/alkaline phosphatase D-like protein
MAERPDLDAVLHVDDYYYEYGMERSSSKSSPATEVNALSGCAGATANRRLYEGRKIWST